MARTLFVSSLVVLAAFSRLLPHPPNVAPIMALALFSGAALDRRIAFLVPLAALSLSDLVIGFYPGWEWVYGSFLATVAIGFTLSRRRSAGRVAGAALTGSVLFFIVTNFASWLAAALPYPRSFAGLMECYAAALPFFRNSLIGDAAYTAALFGLLGVAVKALPALRPATPAEA